MLEAGSDEEAQRTAATVPSKALAVPASLHASLMARIDRLGPAKEVAQIGAAIGREFSHALFTAVARKPEPEVGLALARLIAAGLLFRQGVPPYRAICSNMRLCRTRPMVRCSRAVTRSSRPYRRKARKPIHGDFRASAGGAGASLHRGRLIEKAAELWGEAGRRSLARSALVEAD